ncbi:hypothetical protein [Massilia glaciei]|uniref:Uncharacterized protein n=1 Tax=Massilia glaciei TaxID=1524097 RepID=A0A2U2HNU9_9BURK|nr:hypothetical protein [Massilia glaciei]PWF49177.1 hypothetical protein C7C56_007950 [Massilia glaciei]
MMKTIASLIVLLCCASAANSADELIPGDMDLDDIPKDTWVVFKKSFSMRMDENFIYERGEFINRESQGAMKYQKGDVCKIGSPLVTPNHVRQYFICERGSLSVVLKRSDNTAGEFRSLFGHYFELVSSDPSLDPYAGMDRSIVLELLMTKITNAIKENKHEEALPHFVRLEKLGTPLPESFYYYYIQALAGANQKLDAKTRATNYLTTYGKKGKYYAKVIELLAQL